MTIINAKTSLAGVVGWPIEHSLSPAMQNAAIEKLGLNMVYVAFGVHPDKLYEAIQGARAFGFLGLNITIPHKEAVMAALDEIDAVAAAIGAVNTIHFSEGRAKGYNTDAYGYRRTVEADGGFEFAGKTVLQIGTGGAGRAMAAAAGDAGAAQVTLFDLNAARAYQMAGEMSDHYPATRYQVLDLPEQLGEAAEAADLISNATPLGMKAGDPLPLPAKAIQPTHTVFDAVYNPSETPLLKAAAEAGAKPVPGLGMLGRQGARSLEIWTGQKPDERLMIQVLREKLGL